MSALVLLPLDLVLPGERARKRSIVITSPQTNLDPVST